VKLYCATGNPGKLREFRMAAAHAPVEIGLLPGFRDIPPCVEDGATFEENAVKKARHYGPYAPGLLFADDSGLEVDALGGAPGVLSARYSGPDATDSSNNRLLQRNLEGAGERSARFVCRIALVDGEHLLGTYGGTVEGVILDAPRGEGGFGYDPLFYYPPFGCTFGEATDEQKFSASHRGQALLAMLRELAPAGPPDLSLDPALEEEEYVFCTMAADQASPHASEALGTFTEREGITLILRRAYAEQAGLRFAFPSSRITLGAVTSLDAVGILAAITSALAEHGIAVNAFSAYHHDHLFVPVAQARRALRVLRSLHRPPR
jgi:XTP/dITP diphosphohydrolase